MGLLSVPTGSASADVQVTQQAKLVGQRPVSGRYERSFKNYGAVYTCNDIYVGELCNPLKVYGYRVARGTLRTSLNAYHILDGLKGYDFYLVDVDVDVTDHSGTDRGAWADFYLTTRNATIVDFYDSKSIAAKDDGCHKLRLTLSTPWPFVSAAMDAGSVNFCDSRASLTVSHSGTQGHFHANRLAKINHLTMERVVKVKRGEKPVFRMRTVVPTDSCTGTRTMPLGQVLCSSYDNRTSSVTYSVGTSG
ncbi:hypothetical protein GCM10011584_28050 [Nocardioides phosphati]|uniref:Uncharacterized protein n=1 Tax=Nocardioides phosphati TaxID=1867775 RepID=A0ABQ2NDS8_9ACTN|nr:hypothetical protein GCM10011584_28050 [Nocardioides phosphati]